MTRRRLLIAAMLGVAGFFAAQATVGLGWSTVGDLQVASQTGTRSPVSPEAMAGPTETLEAAAADLYAVNAALLDRQLAEGVRNGILVPYCRGLGAPETDRRHAACATFGSGAAP